MSRDFDWLNELSLATLAGGYIPGEVNRQVAIQWIAGKCYHAEYTLRKMGSSKADGYANKLFNYLKLGYISWSSPVWSNYNNDRGWAVSCFGSLVSDTTASITFTAAECGLLMKLGGGTSAEFLTRPHNSPIGTGGEVDIYRTYDGSVKGRNGVSEGTIHFLKFYESLIQTFKQGSVRRGFVSTYMSIEHGDFDEFMDIGTEKSDVQIMTTGVTISDEFMKRVEAGDREAKRRFARVMSSRDQTGMPYVIFEGNMNGESKPECYKDVSITRSNMCTEIALPASDDETFVCVLSSLNLMYWDEWKDTDLVETMTLFLDTVVEDMLVKYESFDNLDKVLLKRAYEFAKNHRALGLGVLGWHSYLQSKMLPFGSKEALKLNYEIFKTIKEKAYKASEEHGAECGTVYGTNRRNTTLLAVAPTKTSSAILGQVSQGIEPYQSNYFIDSKAKTYSVFKNPFLKAKLAELGLDTPEIWDRILKSDGSVQGIAEIPDDVKAVFSTFGEIDHKVIIDQAAVRQQFIDQAQSINIMSDPEMSARQKYEEIYVRAWRGGVKSLYYQYGINAAQALTRKLQQEADCVGCSA